MEQIVQLGLSSDQLTENEWIQYITQGKHARSFVKDLLTSHWMSDNSDSITDSIALHSEEVNNVMIQIETKTPQETVYNKIDKLPSSLLAECTRFMCHQSCARFSIINRRIFVSTKSFNATNIHKIIQYQLAVDQFSQNEWVQYITRVINNKLMPGSRSRITRLILSRFTNHFNTLKTIPGNSTIHSHLHKINDILSTNKQCISVTFALNALPDDLICECTSFLNTQSCLRLRVTDRQIYLSTKSLKLSHVFLTADNAMPFFNRIGTRYKSIKTIYFKYCKPKKQIEQDELMRVLLLFDILDKFSGAQCVHLRDIDLNKVYDSIARVGVDTYERINKWFANLTSLSVNAVYGKLARDIIRTMSYQLKSLVIVNNCNTLDLAIRIRDPVTFPKLQSLTLELDLLQHGLGHITGYIASINTITTLKDLEIICRNTHCAGSSDLYDLIRQNKQLSKFTIDVRHCHFSFALKWDLLHSVARILNMSGTEMVIRFDTEFEWCFENGNKTQVSEIYELLTKLQRSKAKLTLHIINIARKEDTFRSIWKDLTALTKRNYNAYARPPSIIIKTITSNNVPLFNDCN
eukprot:477200_1